MKSIAEILTEANSLKQKRSVVKKLKDNDSFILRTILQGNFSNKIEFPFPPGPPPYRKNENKVVVTEAQVRKLGLCIKNAKGSSIGKERIFIDFLEEINQNDAEVFCLMKDKALSTKYEKITKKVVEEAFPNLV